MEGKFNYIIIFLYMIYNSILNILWYPLWSLITPQSSKKLKNNRCFYRVAKAKRCFIIGNGPSLKLQDLSYLKDEDVFTVNQFMRNPQHKYIKPICHFWMDLNFFKINKSCPEDIELLQVIKDSAKYAKHCFYPVEKTDFVAQYGISDNAYYICQKLRFHDYYHGMFDFSRFMPGFCTVVQYAIALAIYMGYKEIYLLGCDSTGIMSTLNAAMCVTNNTYAYQVNSREQLRMEKMVKNSNVIDYAYTYYVSLAAYRMFRRYCLKHKIKLINCSEKSVLDSLPYMQYSKCFENSNIN